MDQSAPLNCPLCTSQRNVLFHQDNRRLYWRCLRCQLVFVPPHQYLSAADEKSIYDLHQNNPADTGYRRFLSRLTTPLTERLPDHSTGLDFGCGPGPTLTQILQEQGFSMEIYDPIYADLPEVLQQQYDFITCTEVVEHFQQPGKEFKNLFSLLKPGGILGIMTKLVIDAEAFAHWHYKNDLTHISFFSITTFKWLAKQHQCHIDFLHNDVLILQKNH
jgi:SAM-dependent methyltransferase